MEYQPSKKAFSADNQQERLKIEEKEISIFRILRNQTSDPAMSGKNRVRALWRHKD